MSPTGAYLLETLVTLLAVLAITVLVLVGARRLGVGAPSGPLELVGRLPLDARRAVYLVRVGPQVLVLGASEAGLVKLSELARTDLPEPPSKPRSFASLLGQRPQPRLTRSAEAGTVEAADAADAADVAGAGRSRGEGSS